MAWDFGQKLEDDYSTHTRRLQWFCEYIMLLWRGKGGGGEEKPNKNTNKPKNETPMVQQTQTNSKTTHAEEYKKALHHSLPKNLIASQIFTLGRPEGPELPPTPHPHHLPYCEQRTDSWERKGGPVEKAYAEHRQWHTTLF